jgi:hypothetical protein
VGSSDPVNELRAKRLMNPHNSPVRSAHTSFVRMVLVSPLFGSDVRPEKHVGKDSAEGDGFSINILCIAPTSR